MNDFNFINFISSSINSAEAIEVYYKPRLSKLVIAKYYLGVALGRRKKFPDYKVFWTTAILVSAIQKKYLYFDCQESKEIVLNFFEKNFTNNYKKKLVYLDVAMHGYALLHCHEKIGMKKHIGIINDLADFLICRHPKTTRGILPYRPPFNELAYIDTIGMVCPFLAYFGKIFDRKDATALAVNQILDFFEYGFDPDTNLPYHAYDSLTGEKKGLIGWGRGVGWLLYGMVDTLEFISVNDSRRELLIRKFKMLIDNVLRFQDKSGYLKFCVNDISSHIDTSATAMFGYSLAHAIKLNIISSKYQSAANLSLQALKLSTNENGLIQDCSSECLGWGRYPNEYGAYPWAQGPAIALAVILKYIDS